MRGRSWFVDMNFIHIRKSSWGPEGDFLFLQSTLNNDDAPIAVTFNIVRLFDIPPKRGTLSNLPA
jgi:hypothetical protein